MLKTIALAGFIVLFGHGVAAAQLLVELEGRFWFTKLDAAAKVTSNSLPGTSVDLDKDLGVHDEGLPELRLTLSTGLAGKIRLAYLRGDFASDTTLQRSLQFGGTTFTASSRVESDIEFHYGRIGWAWQFPAVPGIFKIGPLVDVKGLVIDASIRNRTAGSSQRESALLPIAFPTAGLMANVTPLTWLDLFAEASGVPFGDLGHVVDAEAGIRVLPFRFFTIAAGYRILDVRVGDNDDFAKVRLSGPFVGASFRF
jgi:hypothetical protein